MQYESKIKCCKFNNRKPIITQEAVFKWDLNKFLKTYFTVITLFNGIVNDIYVICLFTVVVFCVNDGDVKRPGTENGRVKTDLLYHALEYT